VEYSFQQCHSNTLTFINLSYHKKKTILGSLRRMNIISKNDYSILYLIFVVLVFAQITGHRNWVLKIQSVFFFISYFVLLLKGFFTLNSIPNLSNKIYPNIRRRAIKMISFTHVSVIFNSCRWHPN